MERPWFKHYKDKILPVLDYPPFTIYQLLANSATRFPRNDALMFFGQRISYSELLSLIDTFASSLYELGVRKGDRVAVLLPNCPQMVIAFYGVLKLGAIVVPLNPLYVEREIEFHLRDSGSETLVLLDSLYLRISHLKGNLLKNVIIVDIKDFLPTGLKLLYPLRQMVRGQRVTIKDKTKCLSFKDLISKQLPRVPHGAIPHDIAILQYTGGTTGTPKGALLSHKNIVANVIQLRCFYSNVRDGGERVLSVLPFFHIYGQTVGLNFPLYTGATVILLPTFTPAEVLKAINQYKITILPGIPSLYTALLCQKDIGKYDLTCLKICVSGASPLPLKVIKDFFEVTGVELIEGYGLTEASPVTHFNPLHCKKRFGCIGIPLPDTDCKIVDLNERNREVSPGEVGELCIKGPQVMQGYWMKPEETADSLRDDWLHTGDIAMMDHDGYFSIVDRKKDMILVEGYNVYPREIDEILITHPKVREAAVIGIPDQLRGETVKAFVVLKRGEFASEKEIISFCKERLVKYKVPRYIEFTEELPKTLVGKVCRRILKGGSAPVD